MFKHSPTKFILALAALSVLALFAVYAAFFAMIKRSYNDAATAEAKLQAAVTDASRASAVQKILDSTEEQQKRISAAIVTQDETAYFIDQIDSLAKAAGLVLNVNSIGTLQAPAKIKKNWQYLQISVATQGKWTEIYKFLQMLEHLPFKADLSQTMIQRQGADSKTKQPIWGGQFSITATIPKN